MEFNEILKKITSRDSHKIWESSCEIISMSQKLDKINPLIPYIELIKKSTSNIDLGGIFAPNSRFVNYALRILTFHQNNHEKICSCDLYIDDYECNDPKNEVEKGNIIIEDTIRIEDKWVDFYVCRCLKCGQKFKTIEREGHYIWWNWTKILPSS